MRLDKQAPDVLVYGLQDEIIDDKSCTTGMSLAHISASQLMISFDIFCDLSQPRQKILTVQGRLHCRRWKTTGHFSSRRGVTAENQHDTCERESAFEYEEQQNLPRSRWFGKVYKISFCKSRDIAIVPQTITHMHNQKERRK